MLSCPTTHAQNVAAVVLESHGSARIYTSATSEANDRTGPRPLLSTLGKPAPASLANLRSAIRQSLSGLLV